MSYPTPMDVAESEDREANLWLRECEAEVEALRARLARYRAALEAYAPDILDEIDAALGGTETEVRQRSGSEVT